MTSTEIDTGFLDTIDHAVLLQGKIRVLEARLQETMEVVVGLTPRVDRDTLFAGHAILKESKVAGRKPVWDEVLRRWDAPKPAGWSGRRTRGEPERWPNAPSWVYVLLDAYGTVLYVGKSNQPKTRMSSHTRRGVPWEYIELVACADERDALRLEGDLIHHHAPPWNTQDVRSRRFIPQEAQ